jgi:hypothetical protein
MTHGCHGISRKSKPVNVPRQSRGKRHRRHRRRAWSLWCGLRPVRSRATSRANAQFPMRTPVASARARPTGAAGTCVPCAAVGLSSMSRPTGAAMVVRPARRLVLSLSGTTMSGSLPAGPRTANGSSSPATGAIAYTKALARLQGPPSGFRPNYFQTNAAPIRPTPISKLISPLIPATWAMAWRAA